MTYDGLGIENPNKKTVREASINLYSSNIFGTNMIGCGMNETATT
jgi:hypothetical protein